MINHRYHGSEYDEIFVNHIMKNFALALSF